MLMVKTCDHMNIRSSIKSISYRSNVSCTVYNSNSLNIVFYLPYGIPASYTLPLAGVTLQMSELDPKVLGGFLDFNTEFDY